LRSPWTRRERRRNPTEKPKKTERENRKTDIETKQLK
jgi:hypothetical protein